MRGTDETSGSLFSYVDLEARIPARHPLRKIRQVVKEALIGLDAELEQKPKKVFVRDHEETLVFGRTLPIFETGRVLERTRMHRSRKGEEGELLTKSTRRTSTTGGHRRRSSKTEPR